MQKIFISLILFGFWSKANASRIQNLSIEVDTRWSMNFLPGFTSFSISEIQDPHNLLAIVGNDTFELLHNEHFENPVSNLILFDDVQFEITLLNNSNKPIPLQLSTYNGSYSPILDLKIEKTILAQKRINCELPPLIDQDIWREGLPEPKPNPSTTQVSHMVVHHSATSNSVTNYTLAVRNIYLYHVNNNGWNDVGYNYLIAPDGTLYAGRDGQGKEDDNIRGAHFCAKNSYTMGICLIGNYSETQPSDSMLNTLEGLLAWKAYKEEIHPLELEFHPKGSSTGFDLATICGHRDGYKAGVFSGCQTECPGDNFYSILDTVRFHVFQRLIDCEFFVGSNNRSAQNDIIFSDGVFHLSSKQKQEYQVIDLSGRLLISGQSNGNEIDLSRLPMGVFVVMLQTENRLKSFKIMNYGNQ
jgi:hypothetical protein